MPDPVVIVGGGLAGLSCACDLHAQGIEFVLLEAADDFGGRVWTDEVDGFWLDRGFQVLLTAYPEAARRLDYPSLHLKAFEPGAMIRTGDGFQQLTDPWRRPFKGLQTAFSSIGHFSDKLKIGRLRWSAGQGDVDSLFQRPDRTTEDELRRLGFSNSMLETFLRPFLGGVFLDHELQTSCRMLYFVFRMFSQGDTTLPAKGMGQISKQLVNRLPESALHSRTGVAELATGQVTLISGDVIACSDVIIATDQLAAAKLLPEIDVARPPRSVHCVYFSAPEPPVREKMLLLNGTGKGIVNNFCVPSQVSSDYAPHGQALISATVLQDKVNTADLHMAVQKEMQEWFGKAVQSWKHLRTYKIRQALPNQTSPAFNPPVHPVQLRDHVYICGDYRTNGSINGALQSGRLAAQEFLSRQ